MSLYIKYKNKTKITSFITFIQNVRLALIGMKTELRNRSTVHSMDSTIV